MLAGSVKQPIFETRTRLKRVKHACLWACYVATPRASVARFAYAAASKLARRGHPFRQPRYPSTDPHRFPSARRRCVRQRQLPVALALQPRLGIGCRAVHFIPAPPTAIADQGIPSTFAQRRPIVAPNLRENSRAIHDSKGRVLQHPPKR